jgi:hypothetical protein
VLVHHTRVHRKYVDHACGVQIVELQCPESTRIILDTYPGNRSSNCVVHSTSTCSKILNLLKY